MVEVDKAVEMLRQRRQSRRPMWFRLLRWFAVFKIFEVVNVIKVVFSWVFMWF